MIRNISQEVPPESMDPATAEWMVRRMIENSIAFSQTQNFEPLYVRPEKEEIGMVRYFAAAIDATITSEGLWLYDSTGWVKL